MNESKKNKLISLLLAGTITSTGISLTGCVKENKMQSNPNNYEIQEIDIQYLNKKEPSDEKYYLYNNITKQIVDGPFDTIEEAKERYNKYRENYNNIEKENSLYSYGLIGGLSLTIIALTVLSNKKVPKKIKHK